LRVRTFSEHLSHVPHIFYSSFIFHQSLFPSASIKMGFSMELTPYTATMGGMTGLPLQFAVASIATCAFWLFGYDMSV